MALGGRWWLAAAGAGLLLAGYLLTLVTLGWRRSRRRRARPPPSSAAERRERWAPPPGAARCPCPPNEPRPGRRRPAGLDAKHQAREVGIRNARQAVRCSANAIRAAHRTELDRAGELLAQAGELLEVASTVLAAHPDILYAGFLQDAQKEYAEALATRALVAGDPLPSPEDVGVGDAPYLNGLAETVGELRRHLLDVLRAGDVPQASALFAAMEEIHALLADLDYRTPSPATCAAPPTWPARSSSARAATSP